MAKAFKFRYVNELAGLFVLATLGVLISAALVASETHKWFQPVTRINVELPPQGSLGLRAGSVVSMLGTEVGDVANVNPPDADGRMEALITVRTDFAQFIKADSRAVISREFGVAGDATLEIMRGTGDPLGENATIKASTDTAVTDQLQQTLKLVQDQIVPTIKEVRTAIEAYTDVAHDLHDPDGHLQQVLARLDAIAGDIQASRGLAGKIVSDPTLAANVSTLLVNADKTSASLASVTADADQEIKQVPALITDIQRTLKALQGVMADAKKTTVALPGVVVQTQETLREVDKLVEQLQHNWLLGGNGGAAAPAPGRISPSEAGGTR
jgi:phospholipid/cholesterol/gamma-HCH transport system substrate-binding protein